MIVEQHDDVVWQRGMLLPWAQSQVSFLKDLVTLRNPRSKFTFVNYLHKVGRLNDFVNLGCFTPYRLEISDYLQWVARPCRRADAGWPALRLGRAGARRNRRRDQFGSWRWPTARIVARNLVVAAGRDAHVPRRSADCRADRVIHSTEFAVRFGDRPGRTSGWSSSAARRARPRCCGRPPGVAQRPVHDGDAFHRAQRLRDQPVHQRAVLPVLRRRIPHARPEAREQLLREMHRTNYAGLAPACSRRCTGRSTWSG